MGALTGLRVIDLSRFYAGPFCAMQMGDLGADVIKLEVPTGESLRHYPPFVGGVSLQIQIVNRNKRSLTMNLKDRIDVERLWQLIEKADVMIENFLPGTLERLGFDWESLRARNPRLVLVRITGAGQGGPLADRPSFDGIGQAQSGLMSMNGEREGPPMMIGTFVADYTTGLYATIGALAALQSRERTGEGQIVDVSLVESAASLTMTAIPLAAMGLVAPERNGNRDRNTAPTNIFQSADDRWVYIMAGGGKYFDRFRKVLSPGPLDQPQFNEHVERMRHAEELEQIVAAWARQRNASAIDDLMAQAGVPCAIVASIEDVAESAVLQKSGFLVDVKQADGSLLRVPGSPLRLSETPVGRFDCAPALDEHRAEILADWLGK